MSNKKRSRQKQWKLAELQLHAECVSAELPNLTYDEMLIAGVEHRNVYSQHDEQDHMASESSDKETLERLAVNYARHCLRSGYDSSYFRPLRNLSHREAKEVAVKAALSQIGLRWPELMGECIRQRDERL